MNPTIAVDIISDLRLTNTDDFDWDGKQTSLFCVVTGNVSSDLEIVEFVLKKLSQLYRGVFYIDGPLEHSDILDYDSTIDSIKTICENLSNTIYLHNHVVVLNKIAFVACNGWYKNVPDDFDYSTLLNIDEYRIDDIGYISKTIKSLQIHKDAEKIAVISNCIPSEALLFRNRQDSLLEKVEPGLSLTMDSENKVTTWIFSGSDLLVDTTIRGRRFVNNPKIDGQPYWPKRIEI